MTTKDATKRCRVCSTWKPFDAFGVDRSRRDGRAYECRSCKNQRGRTSYRPRPRPEVGRRYVSARDGDKRQARRRVNYLVDAGLIPDPDDLDCSDCGHRGYDRRHEYDHARGYAPEHHEDVEPVCSTCHHRREKQRG